jgi:hypothetical protein
MSGPDAKIAAKLAVALVHHPVLNRRGEEVTSSVTTIDVHDFARTCRTYGVKDLFIITPIKTQQRLVERLSRHWTHGYGAEFNPSRKEALTCVKVVDSVDDMIDNLKLTASEITLVTTGAKSTETATGYLEARRVLEGDGRFALLFGTGHGLAPQVMSRASLRLAPIEGVDGFNHLPVRCAAAIILDRLIGQKN